MSRTMASARPRPSVRSCCVAMGVLVVSSALLALAGWRTAGSESFAPVAGLPLVMLLVGMIPVSWQMLCGVQPKVTGGGWLFALALVALATSAWALTSPAPSTVGYLAAAINLFGGVVGLMLLHAFTFPRALVTGHL